jgi:hypothetical protein
MVWDRGPKEGKMSGMRSMRGVFILTVVVMMMMAITPMAGANGPLVDNGDFEDGNVDFQSEYRYVGTRGSTAMWPERTYAVDTDANLYHSAWTSFSDHPAGDGNMMIVNGTPTAETPKALVWGQNVTLPDAFGDEISYPLYAGQTWEVGEVLVKNDANQICVKLVMTDVDAIAEGWLITEAHVALGDQLSDIPQTSKYNPIPGQFPVNEDFDPGVTETDWFCFDHGYGNVFIAAHAALVGPVDGTYWANNVVSSRQGLTKGDVAVDAERSHTFNALGEPSAVDDLLFFALGFGGEIVVEFEGWVANVGSSSLLEQPPNSRNPTPDRIRNKTAI